MTEEFTFQQAIGQQNNLHDALLNVFKKDPAKYAELFDEHYTKTRPTASA